MKKISLMLVISVMLVIASALSAAPATQTFSGVITDTMCGAKHGMVKDQSDEACIKMCVKGSSEYALNDGKSILKLSDQKNAAKFAAKRVKVTGTFDEKSKTIKVTGIEAEN